MLSFLTPKDYAAGLGGIIAGAITWGAVTLLHLSATDAITLGGVLVAVIPPIITRFTPPGDRLVLQNVNDTIAQAGTILGKLTPASDSTQPPSTKAVALADKAT